MNEMRPSRSTVARIGLFVGLLGLPVAGLAVDPQDPPMGVFSNEWFAVMLNGHKSGHMHSQMERRRGAGGDVIRTQTEMSMTAGRGETNITVSVDQQTEETLAGEPLGFTNTMKLGFMPSTTRGTIRDGKVTVTTSQFGQQGQTAVYDLPKGAMMSWAVYREQLKRGLKPGTKYSLPLYEPTMSMDQLTPATIEIGDKQTIDLFGRKVEAIKTVQTVALKGLLGQQNVETVTWMTEEGDAVRLEMKMLNIPVEVIACAKPIALAKNDPDDLMALTLVDAGEPIDASVPSITYRLRWTRSPQATSQPALPETDMQKVAQRPSDGLLLTVTRRSAGRPHAAKLTDKEREQYLAAAPMVNYRDPVVAKLAREAAGGEKDPLKLADRLRKFVGDYIKSKTLGVGFATASEVARSKEGDCTEHAILLAALGRALGIPTRVVPGIVYADRFGPRRDVFVGHMWTQFWINGQWVDLDAALHQTDVDPTHIALGVSAASDNGVADLVGSLWLTMGNLSVQVVKPGQ